MVRADLHLAGAHDRHAPDGVGLRSWLDRCGAASSRDNVLSYRTGERIVVWAGLDGVVGSLDARATHSLKNLLTGVRGWRILLAAVKRRNVISGFPDAG